MRHKSSGFASPYAVNRLMSRWLGCSFIWGVHLYCITSRQCEAKLKSNALWREHPIRRLSRRYYRPSRPINQAAFFMNLLYGMDKTISRKSSRVLNPSTRADHPSPLRASDGVTLPGWILHGR